MRWLLLGFLLLPPLQTYAIENPFKPDHRVDGLVVIGTSIAVSGVALFFKKPAKDLLLNTLEMIAASSLLASGIVMVLCAPDLIKKFDQERGR